MLVCYNLLLLTAVGLLCPIWIPVVLLRRKYRDTFLQRLYMPPEGGRTNAAAAGRSSQPIWIHALSVGEVLSAEPLVKALAARHGAADLIFSASTHTGVATAKRVIAPFVSAVTGFPYDTPFSVDRALAIIRPRQVVIVETDIWPNFLHRLHRRGIPAYLVNARLSDRTYRGYRRIGAVMRPLLASFRHICVQTERDRRRFLDLGVPADRIAAVGNLKFDQLPETVSDGDRRQLADRLALPTGRFVWVAGSTHPGEEALIAEACRRLRDAGDQLTLIIAPRDPGRAGEVSAVFRQAGSRASTLAQVEATGEPSSVVVIDRIGLLRRLYALADVAFVGGSLVKAGGHNPLEPASVAVPILFGPHTEDFRWICATLEAAGGACRVTGAAHLADIVRGLAIDRDRRRRIGQAARAVFSDHQGAVARTLTILHPGR